MKFFLNICDFIQMHDADSYLLSILETEVVRRTCVPGTNAAPDYDGLVRDDDLYFRNSENTL